MKLASRDDSSASKIARPHRTAAPRNGFLSSQLLADILSLPKRQIDARIRKGELIQCPKTKLISQEQLSVYPEFRQLALSTWDKELKTKPRRTYRLVELFAGAGGLALGMEQAGLKGVLLNDIDKEACATLRHNRPAWNVVCESIDRLDFSNLNCDVDVLTGGFPCQAFSYAGKSLGLKDKRGTLFFEMARAIRTLKPKIFAAENVRALLTQNNGETIQIIEKEFAKLGYKMLKPKILKAIFYKVPQKRERLILIGIRKDIYSRAEFQWPSPYKRVLTVNDAFSEGDLYDSAVPNSLGQLYPKRKREIMRLIPPGGYWRDLPEKLQREYMMGSYFLGGGKTGMARRLSLHEPSLTLTCAPAQKQTERCHPLETRPLTTREYARIQTFPDSWEFIGSLSSVYKQIGNAVPVNMAAALGRSIVRFLNRTHRAS